VNDDGPAISYKLLERGTAVHASDGEQVGKVDQVLDNVREDIFDGIVVRTDNGDRFVDAPEVARITEHRVTLSIDAAGAAQLPRYEPGAPQYEANTRAGRLARLLGRSGWNRR
jgi:hypothetical protein